MESSLDYSIVGSFRLYIKHTVAGLKTPSDFFSPQPPTVILKNVCHREGGRRLTEAISVKITSVDDYN